MEKTQPVDFIWDFDLVLFDLDGTLVDSSQDIANSINFTLASFGIPPWPVSTIKTFIGNGSMRLIERALAGRMEHASQALQIFTKHYQQHVCDHSNPFPGVETILDRLSDLPLAIMSNKRERFIHPLLEYLGWENRFDWIVGSDSLNIRKPDPRPLLWICEQAKIPPNRTVMIGDSPVDVKAGKAAGMATVGLTGGFTTPEAVRDEKPSLTLHFLRELETWLR